MEKMYDNKKFAAVWERVMPEAAEDTRPRNALSPEETAALLRTLINSTARGETYYKALAKRYQGKGPGKVFSTLAREEAEHLRKLQTAHYLLTGDTCVPQAGQVRIPSVLAALRACYLNERDGEKAFTLASLQDDEPKRTQLYTRIAGDAARHALLLENLMENAL